MATMVCMNNDHLMAFICMGAFGSVDSGNGHLAICF
jgi:hypothetical protein